MDVFSLIITICIGQTSITECNTFIVPEYSSHSIVHARNYAASLKRELMFEFKGQHIVVSDSVATQPDRVLGYVADMISMAGKKYPHHFKTI